MPPGQNSSSPPVLEKGKASSPILSLHSPPILELLLPADGTCGDLAPLAHIAVVLTRDEREDGGYSGQAYFDTTLMGGAEAMARAGLTRKSVTLNT